MLPASAFNGRSAAVNRDKKAALVKTVGFDSK